MSLEHSQMLPSLKHTHPNVNARQCQHSPTTQSLHHCQVIRCMYTSARKIFNITILPLWLSPLTQTWTKRHTIHHEITTETQTKPLAV